MKRIVSVLILLSLFLFSMGVTHAQNEEGLTESQDQKGLVSFDFKDADIRNVLRIFSHKTGINIVADPKVEGSVTVKLNNVPWEKALKIILEMNDFAYIREGNVIKVLTRDRIAQEPLKTEVLTLDYAKAQNVVPTVESMLTERGSVQVDERANLLIISDVPSSFDPIKKVIKRLDLPTPQVLIETKLIETDLNFQKKFGVKWNFIDEYSLTYGGAGGVFQKIKTKSISDNWVKSLSNGKETEYTEEYGALFIPPTAGTDLYDRDGDGNVTEVWSDVQNDYLYGEKSYDYTDWAYANGAGSDGEFRNNYYPHSQRFYTTTDGDSGYRLTRQELHDFDNPIWGLSGAGFTETIDNASSRALTSSDNRSTTFNTTMTANAFNVVLSALLNDDGSDILSAPSVVTMDNKEATIKVASDFPMPAFGFNEDTGSYEITGFTPTPIGITMKVTPHVAPNGYVTIDLNPEVSRIDREIPMAALGANIPQIGRENIITSVMVKDGDTVVLGGLIKQFDTYTNQKVPLLHSIPYLGWLFKHKEKEIQKRNLLIFVTPNILKKENIGTITQNKADVYTKTRETFEEPTQVYPNIKKWE